MGLENLVAESGEATWVNRGEKKVFSSRKMKPHLCLVVGEVVVEEHCNPKS